MVKQLLSVWPTAEHILLKSKSSERNSNRFFNRIMASLACLHFGVICLDQTSLRKCSRSETCFDHSLPTVVSSGTARVSYTYGCEPIILPEEMAYLCVFLSGNPSGFLPWKEPYNQWGNMSGAVRQNHAGCTQWSLGRFSHTELQRLKLGSRRMTA